MGGGRKPSAQCSMLNAQSSMLNAQCSMLRTRGWGAGDRGPGGEVRELDRGQGREPGAGAGSRGADLAGVQVEIEAGLGDREGRRAGG
jgi:hypothetical protein